MGGRPWASPRGSERVVVLGVGAQKAGTSWFYDHLAQSPEFEPGIRKEYHVFDSLDLPEQAYAKNRILHHARDALTHDLPGPAQSRALLRAAMLADQSHYFDHFATLFARSPQARVSADITPAYAMLTPERFRAIRSAFAERGIRAVAVFLMRDPIDRAYSQLRMQHSRTPEKFDRSLEAELLARHDEPSFAGRSSFELTIAALDAAFAPDDIGYGFFETLFHPEEVRRLTGLAGASYVEPRAQRVVNRSTTPPRPLSAETVRTVARAYAPTYHAVSNRFPDLDLERLWPNSRFV